MVLHNEDHIKETPELLGECERTTTLNFWTKNEMIFYDIGLEDFGGYNTTFWHQ